MPEKLLKDLREYNGDDRVISSNEMKIILSQSNKPAFHVNSGIKALDRLVEGFNGGELITISGYTKQGKTLFAKSLTMNFIKQKENPLWFSYEVPTREFLNKFPIFPQIFLPARLRAYALDWVEDRILESFQKYNTRIVFIDHLHFLFDMARVRNTSLEIGTVIRRLKGLCIEHEFVIFLLCHTKKGKDNDDLSYDSIRDSSLVAQESDSVFLIKRTPKVNEDSAQLKVEFHRRTGIFEKGFNLIKKNGLLYEWEVEEK